MRLVLFFALFSFAGCAEHPDEQASRERSTNERPNILLVVVDDMGFSDIGSFGGEIATPNLDRIAYAGVRFSNFHTASTCSPTRSMLFTGVDSHRAGLGNMLEELAPNQKGQLGYEGFLNDRVVTLPKLMRDGGYRTYMTGKWHLGSDEGQGPAERGFERSFALMSGGASHYPDMRPSYAPSPEIKANYNEDGVKLSKLPDEFVYSTQYYVDRMIGYLQDHGDSKEPFFAYLSFTAPHWPLQAPDESIARHKGRYDEGYDVLAETRLKRLKALGLVPESAQRSGRSPKEKPWNELTADEQRKEVRAMEIYAAMIDEVDRHTGRLIEHLERMGVADDTVIMFMSDNGAEGHDLDETWPMEAFPNIRKTIDSSFDFSYESMGKPGSYVLYGPNWANAAAPAFRLHKAFPTEGGTRVTAFVHDPRFENQASIVEDFVYVTDVTPTILELAGLSHPGTEYEGRTVETPVGISFSHHLRGEIGTDEPRVVSAELFGKRAVRAGQWKLVHMPPPYGSNEWQLFDLETDLAETIDVAAEHPKKVQELRAYWEQYATENNVIIPDWVSGY